MFPKIHTLLSKTILASSNGLNSLFTIKLSTITSNELYTKIVQLAQKFKNHEYC